MFRIVHAGVLVALLAVTGCQHLPTVRQGDSGSDPQPKPAEPRRDNESRRLFALLDYYRRSAELDEEMLQRRLAILESRLKPGVCSSTRIRFAILLTRLPPGDAAGDGSLLAPCTTHPPAGATAEARIAPLLTDLMAARHARAETHAEAQGLESKLADAQAENGKLRKQLEGLKAIEESLQERGTPEEE